MFVAVRRLASLTMLAVALSSPRDAAGQSTQYQACSQGVLANCAGIRLTTQLGVGPGGTNLFQIAVQNLGSPSSPALATSIYFLAFLTGQGPATPGTEVNAFATPTSQGGATISDTSPWSVFESGDAIFLSAPGADGIGGCAASAPVGGFGQMAQTCGISQFITFNFFTTRTLDPSAFTLADMEIVSIAAGNAADSCNDTTPCLYSPLATATPEPGSLLLLATGLSGLAGLARNRRRIAARATTTEG